MGDLEKGDALSGAASGKKRYIKKGLQSDFVVSLVYAEREFVVFHNPRNLPNGAARRIDAWKGIQDSYNAKYPGEEKEAAQLESHFAGRLSSMKSSLAKRNQYRMATGGGVDLQMEALCEQLEHPTAAEQQLIECVMKTPGALGVGSCSLETGTTSNFGRPAASSDTKPVATARLPLPCKGKKRLRKMKQLTPKALLAAQAKSLGDFLRVSAEEMKKNAIEKGLRPASAQPAKRPKAD